MAKLSVRQVLEQGASEIERHPEGIRFGDLLRWFREVHPEVPEGTIGAQLPQLPQRFPERITKPARGLYVPVLQDDVRNVKDAEAASLDDRKEADLYEPFATFLKNELDEVTNVASLGGASLRQKWGTPDVVGTFRPRATDVIKFSPEIVSAEIKNATDQSVVAFGQAVSYRLFSHKSYIVVPSATEPRELARLEALCLLFGVGLVVFEWRDGKAIFAIRSRALRVEPDSFFMNEFARNLSTSQPDVFSSLFD